MMVNVHHYERKVFIKPSLAWLGHLGLLYYISIYKLYSTFFLQIYDRAQLEWPLLQWRRGRE